jgi:hypothetical protein
VSPTVGVDVSSELLFEEDPRDLNAEPRAQPETPSAGVSG